MSPQEYERQTLGMSAPTKHTCNRGQGPHFGRLTAGCPRCDELAAGAAARDPHPRIAAAIERDRHDQARAAEIRDHFASAQHRTGGCGPVCTFGDW